MAGWVFRRPWQRRVRPPLVHGFEANPVLVEPGTLELELQTFAPDVTASDHQTVTPDTLELTTTLYEPTVTASDHKTVTPDTVELTTTLYEPTVTASDHQTVTPGTVDLTTTLYEPTVTFTEHVTVIPDTVELTLTGYEPTVSVGGGVTVTPATLDLALTTYAPDVTTGYYDQDYSVLVVLQSDATEGIQVDPANYDLKLDIDGLAAGTPAGTDYLVYFDAAAGVHKKITVADFQAL